MCPKEKPLIWFLRLTAIMLLAAAGAVVMPYSWMNAIHEWLGLGTLPDAPLVGYLTRSLSALYAFLGALSWHVALDVRHYLRALRLTVPLEFAFSVTLIAIDLSVAMPMWWTAIEGSILLGWTLALWWLVRSFGTDISPGNN